MTRDELLEKAVEAEHNASLMEQQGDRHAAQAFKRWATNFLEEALEEEQKHT